uniref:ID289 n=1 Tax=Bradyrhizobium japonicum TaxID=375 RepID=Q9ANE4_BRAJP|nr:ID289 [Bradyrhizobium japonicum]
MPNNLARAIDSLHLERCFLFIKWTSTSRHGLPAKLTRMRRIGSPRSWCHGLPRLPRAPASSALNSASARRLIGRTNAHGFVHSETDRRAQFDGMVELCRRCLTTIPN